MRLPRRDPAPTRLSYRMQRLLLTPMFRRAVRWGLPLSLLVAGAALWLGDAERREILIGGAAELRRQIEARPEFQVKVLAIDGASPDLAEAIREELRLRLPVSSFDLQLPELRERVAAFDPVSSARVVVRPGGILQVDVVQRTPAAVHRGQEGLVLLDATGHRIGPLARRADRTDLPLLVGKGARAHVAEALALDAAARPLAPRLRGFVRVGERRWDVVLDRGQRILLPETGAERALDQAIALDRAQELLARDVVALDLRNPRRPTLRLGPEAAETMHAVRTGPEAAR